jgi:hypothetical protein
MLVVLPVLCQLSLDPFNIIWIFRLEGTDQAGPPAYTRIAVSKFKCNPEASAKPSLFSEKYQNRMALLL